MVVLRLCGSSQRGAQLSTDLRHRPALAGSLDRLSVVSGWLSSIAEAFGVALWLTMLPCAGPRGRFGNDGIPMSMPFGSEAEGAARAARQRASAPC
eukprot:scaffold16060_cov107-Isochrysis_galbana.AAC.4